VAKRQCGNKILSRRLKLVGATENGWKILNVSRHAGTKGQTLWDVQCAGCGSKSSRVWQRITKTRCGKCYRSVDLYKKARMEALKDIPDEMFRLPDIVEAIVQVFGAMTRKEVGYVLGRQRGSAPYTAERIRQIEREALSKLYQEAGTDLKENYWSRQNRGLSVWDELEEEACD